MNRAHRGLVLLAALLLAGAARAEEEEPEPELRRSWSMTLMGEFKIISDPQANDDVGDFFDQYEFTPNKSSSVPFELGIRDAAFDEFGPGDTPRLQFRFESPTSNLGVSGSQVDQPFLNQNAQLFGRYAGFALDLEYWRFRTEDLRRFPQTLGRPYYDLTNPSDRFNHDRTGFFGEMRMRPHELGGKFANDANWLAPELSLRAGYDNREGQKQRFFLLNETNSWGALSQELDQDVVKAGGGVLVAPGGLFTMTFDVDYDGFRNDAPTILEGDLGIPFSPPDNTVGFIPGSDRITGTIQLQGRIGDRVVIESGFLVSRIEQADEFTPQQMAAGLDENSLLFYSANVGAKIQITDPLSANAFFKWDRRDNEIQRDTALFNPSNGSQVDEFLKTWDRIYTGAEVVYDLHRRNLVAVGARFEWIDRELDFAVPNPPLLAILAPNALMGKQTSIWTVYARTDLRPLKGLGVNAEIGYRGAPSTGYILDLDKNVYGKLRASYVIPTKRPVVLSAFAQGGSGENHDFQMVDGVYPMLSGPELPLAFDRWNLTWGLTATMSLRDDISVFASFFRSCVNQDFGLDRSNFERYRQTSLFIDFFGDGAPEFRDKQMSFVVGSHARLSKKTDGGLSYSLTNAESHYNQSVPSANVQLISNNHNIDSYIHGLQFEAGHWLRDGLRVLVGYRLQLLNDFAPVPSGVGSVVQPIPPSMTQHTVTLGVTLTSDLFAKSD